MLASRKRFTGAVALAVVASGFSLLPLAPAQAASTGLVINEVYMNGGSAGASYTDRFVELYNPTGGPITFTGSVQYRSATGTAAASGVAPLNGVTVASHGYFLIKGASNGTNGDALPAPDLTATGLNMAGGATGGGTVFITTATAATNPTTDTGIVDRLGYGTSNFAESTAPAAGWDVTHSLTRTNGVDTDANAADFTSITPPTPTNSGPATPASLEATAVSDKTAYVGVPIGGFNLAATGGTSPYTWGATGLPDGVTVSSAGAVSGTPTTAGAYAVTATVTDSASATETVTFTVTVGDTPALRTIADVQGTGARSPLAPPTGTDPGETVRVQGVVTGMYADPYPAQLADNGGLDGMYIQSPGPDTDGSSDAVFVYGNSSMPAGVAIGDSVEVIGSVSEFAGLTEITPGAGGVSEIASIGSATPRAIAYPTTEETREDREGELLAPTDDFTVTNSYSTNQYGEIGLATGDHPLVQPTEIAADDDAAGLAAVKADNAARAVVLDDGTSINYLTNDSPQQDLPLPWLTADHAVRVGASVDFEQPVILDYRNNAWKFQPSEPVLDDGADVATFQDTRALNETPQDVGGDLKIATFNVLNYFNTTGEQYVANGAAQVPPVNTACTYYTDRDGNRIGNNTCGVVTNGTNAGNGPRGAATTVSYQRQRDKIVTAINALDADIVGLEEIENSMKLTGETNRDDAVAALVAALNADTGAATWRYVHSPGEALVASAVSEQDVIRPAFIYKQAKVTPVGQSDILFGTTEFANAREPLAQAFKPKGALDSTAFAVIVNHFKSKGDSNPAQSGNDNVNNPDTGAFNGDRTRQATRLAAFANEFATARGIDAVFLAGDFNSYTKEDPMQVLYGAGYAAIESDTAGEETYSFGGLSGSLDHVLGNAAAMNMVEGADIWDINAAESVAYQYSRYNYNVRQLFDADNPFAASDHNPEIVGINLHAYSTAYTPIQVVATNDFHGRLLADGANAAGAAVLSGAVKEMRADNPDTVFAAAGDLIGASTFESFIQHDEPTIDALNEAGLQVSSAGNHEFDAGYDDLLGRVQDRADWEYIASNVHGPAGGPQLAKSYKQTFTTPAGPIVVGFVGAVTEDLPSLVSPGGMVGVTVDDIVDSVNAEADNLRDNQGADLVIMLVHEGAPTTSCASMTDPNTTWGHIVTGIDDGVDAIVSGHTHLAYNCSFPVAGWAGRDVTERPVVSAGQYGTNLNQLMFTFDNTTGELVATSQDIVNLTGTGFAPDPAVTTIVDDAKAKADVLGAVKLGEIGGVFNRAKLADSTTENRGGESTLGNLVAEVQRWATETPEAGSAQIAFMNPGGLRADMVGTVEGATRNLTYKQAAVVQPFANTLVNMRLTGANLKLVLEQQWQRDASGNVPTRAFLRLGVSKGFTYTYDPAKAEGSRITGMWLNGVAIDPAASYSVTVNSFLATGGDNFRGFTNGTGTRDTGKADLQAMVDYMAEFADTTPLPVDYSQRAVGVSFPAGAPASYLPGEHVLFNVSSWAMSTAADTKDTAVTIKLGNQELGEATLDNAPTTALNDELGKATVDVVLPAGAAAGATSLTLVGKQTGTSVSVPLTIGAEAQATVSAGDDLSVTWGDGASIPVTVTGDDGVATGKVKLFEGTTQIGPTVDLADGAATLPVAAKSLEPGAHTLRVEYSDGNYPDASDTVVLTVAKAMTTVSAADVTGTYGEPVVVTVVVGDDTATGRVEIRNGDTVLGSAELSDGTAASVTLPAGSLEPGVTNLTAAYVGDDYFLAGTDAFTATIAAAPQAEVSAGDDLAITWGDGVSIPVTVTGNGGVATGSVRLFEGTTPIGVAVTLVNGAASLPVAARSLEPGAHTLRVEYSGSYPDASDTVVLTVAKAAPTVSAGNVSLTYGKSAVVTVNVGPSGATGTVRVLDGAKVLGTATVSGGVAKVTLAARSLKPGSHALTAVYSGDSHVASGSNAFTASVAKAGSSTKTKDSPSKVKVKKTRVTLKITVTGQFGVVATGKVKVKVPGQGTTTVTLRSGKATLKLDKFTSTGKKTIRVDYQGSDLLKPSADTVKIKVVRK